MVWKFNTAVAQEKHAERSGQLEPSLPVIPELTTSGEPRVEPSFFTQEPAPSAAAAEPFYLPEPATGSVDLEPMTFEVEVPRSVTADEADQEPQFLTVETRGPDAEDLGIPMLTVQLEDVPSGDLNWDIPAFQGSVDELPDLRPKPPAPEDHPGLLHRTVNNFGHALRFAHDDPRQALWAEQRRDRGFDDTELYGLDDTFARFILPRLKALRQQKLTPPLRMELAVWYSMLDKMIRAFELLLPEGGGAWDRGKLTDKERSQLQEGLDHFRQYYFSLGW
jgi:hypothetical protein